MRIGIALVAFLLMLAGPRESWAQRPTGLQPATDYHHVVVVSGASKWMIIAIAQTNKCRADGQETSYYHLYKEHPNYDVLATILMSAYVTLSKVTLRYSCASGRAGIHTVMMRR